MQTEYTLHGFNYVRCQIGGLLQGVGLVLNKLNHDPKVADDITELKRRVNDSIRGRAFALNTVNLALTEPGFVGDDGNSPSCAYVVNNIKTKLDIVRETGASIQYKLSIPCTRARRRTVTLVRTFTIKLAKVNWTDALVWRVLDKTPLQVFVDPDETITTPAGLTTDVVLREINKHSGYHTGTVLLGTMLDLLSDGAPPCCVLQFVYHNVEHGVAFMDYAPWTNKYGGCNYVPCEQCSKEGKVETLTRTDLCYSAGIVTRPGPLDQTTTIDLGCKDPGAPLPRRAVALLDLFTIGASYNQLANLSANQPELLGQLLDSAFGIWSSGFDKVGGRYSNFWALTRGCPEYNKQVLDKARYRLGVSVTAAYESKGVGLMYDRDQANFIESISGVIKTWLGSVRHELKEEPLQGLTTLEQLPDSSLWTLTQDIHIGQYIYKLRLSFQSKDGSITAL